MTYPETRQQLGAIYTENSTLFRLWAPTRKEVNLLLYKDPKGEVYKKLPMKACHDGTFEVHAVGDLKGEYYHYEIEGQKIVDPYALSTAINSTHGAIIDLRETNPPGFLEHRIPRLSYKDAIIYETHVRDLTGDPEISYEHPGTFLGVRESHKLEGVSVGIDHVKEMGITHVHLLPVQDFVTVDEEKGGYNWGYDPELYFNLEGSYVLQKDDPHKRLYEFKQMVMDIHKKGMGVVMDVVYNHTYRTEDSVYEKIVPGYYHRQSCFGEFHDGSGCGNELNTEKPMVGRLIVESLEFFARECQVDGFRFDLLGLMDIERTNEIIRRLRRINPNILIYGEPWGGGESGLEPSKMTLHGRQKRRGFSLFNDQFRDALKGRNDDESLGYVQGNILGRNGVITGIAGSIAFSDQIYGFTESPYESVNYHSSHDNLILYDKLKLSTKKSDEEIERLTKLTFGILLLSFGIPFIHAGTEFMRTKKMHHNTYNLGDEINVIRWRDKLRWIGLSDFVKGLIDLRKHVDAFGYYNDDDIRKELTFLYSPMIIAYILELGDDHYKRLFIAHNPTPETLDVPFRVKEGNLLVHDGRIMDKNYGGEKLTPHSTMVIGIIR